MLRAMSLAKILSIFLLLCSPMVKAQDGLGDLLPLFDLEFETREGLISCSLIRLETGEGALVNCLFEDGTPVPEDVRLDLGLKPEEAIASEE